MRPTSWLLFLMLLFSGCFQMGCLDCDDGNPCTQDYCENGKCEHQNLTGPVSGCFGSGGCIEYGCFSGQCIPQKSMECCGNGVCEGVESASTCAKDCQPTCDDGLKNQGESEIDCGGPCKMCSSRKTDILKRISEIRGRWQASSEMYSNAIKDYNTDRDKTKLRLKALESYGEVQVTQVRMQNLTLDAEDAELIELMNRSIQQYLESLHVMILYLNTDEDVHRVDSNRIYSDAMDVDREFVALYNLRVAQMVGIQKRCNNYIFDVGEESIDCGDICERSCTTRYNITKYVRVNIEGGRASLGINISSPAIDYQPTQKLIATYSKPKPVESTVDEEGNIYYFYSMDLPAYALREIEIVHEIEMYRVAPPAKSDSEYFSFVYLTANNFSQMTDEMCYVGKNLRVNSEDKMDLSQNIVSWLVDQVDYEMNLKEYGAEYTFLTRKGACDEHADLFISLSRCSGMASRRVTGSLFNQSQLNGHAWAEYYDGGWIYVDPSIKNVNRSFAPDNNHITSCVGEGAYHCGLGYRFTYTGNKPRIDVTERVFLS